MICLRLAVIVLFCGVWNARLPALAAPAPEQAATWAVAKGATGASEPKRDRLRERLAGRKAISIWRTPGGWGTGPSYRIELFSDGELVYSGVARDGDKEARGLQSARIEPSAFVQIETEFFRLQANRCDTRTVTDQGTIFYRLLSNTQTTEFSVYTGCLSPADRGQRLSKVIKDTLRIDAPKGW